METEQGPGRFQFTSHWSFLAVSLVSTDIEMDLV